MSNINFDGNISAAGDIIIGDNNKNNSKLWINCSSEELREDFHYRKKLLNHERVGKWKIIAIAWIVVGLAAVMAAVYFYFTNQPNLSSLIMGISGIFMAFATIKIMERPTDFEQRQILALNEIKILLKERGEWI